MAGTSRSNPENDLGENSKVRPLERGEVGGGDQQETSENELPYEENPEEDGLGEATSGPSCDPSGGKNPTGRPSSGPKPGGQGRKYDFGVFGETGGSWVKFVSLKGIPMVEVWAEILAGSARCGGCFRIRTGRLLYGPAVGTIILRGKLSSPACEGTNTSL